MTETNLVGKFLLVNKHIWKGKEKKSRRVDFTEADIPQQRELAAKYSEQNNGEDFLIVQVVEEIKGKKKEKAS
jgi:hypothetical protein